MRCNKCNSKATKKVDKRYWCDKCLTKFLRSAYAQSKVIAKWEI